MESVLKNVRDNIFSIVSVNKEVKKDFQDFGINDEELKSLLISSLQKVKLPTAKEVAAAESKEGHPVFSLDKCKAIHIIESIIMAEAAEKDDLCNWKGLTKDMKEMVSLAENKVFVRLLQDLHKFQELVNKKDISSLEKHNSVNPYFHTTKEAKKALKETELFSKLNSVEKKLVETEYVGAITMAVLSRMFSLYCPTEFQEAVDSKDIPMEEEGVKCSGGCKSGCCNKTSESKEEKQDDDDPFVEKIIYFTLGLLAGMVIYHFIGYLY